MLSALSLSGTFGDELISNKKVNTSGHLFVPSSSFENFNFI
jgi:hypothetical protein